MHEALGTQPHGQAKFPLGHIVTTPGALDALERANQYADEFLRRHAAGDWADLPDEDRAANDHAVGDGERLLSAYTTQLGTKLWVITEWDRSVTTILLPSEY